MQWQQICDLSDSGIKQAIHSLHQLSNVNWGVTTTLRLDSNAIPHFDPPEPVALQALHLDHNLLTRLDGATPCVASVTLLSASHNAIASLDGTHAFTGLVYLVLSHNRITSLCGLRGTALCRTLEVLLIAFNHISSLADICELAYLRQLHVLDFRGNALPNDDVATCLVLRSCPKIANVNGIPVTAAARCVAAPYLMAQSAPLMALDSILTGIAKCDALAAATFGTRPLPPHRLGSWYPSTGAAPTAGPQDAGPPAPAGVAPGSDARSPAHAAPDAGSPRLPGGMSAQDFFTATRGSTAGLSDAGAASLVPLRLPPPYKAPTRSAPGLLSPGSPFLATPPRSAMQPSPSSDPYRTPQSGALHSLPAWSPVSSPRGRHSTPTYHRHPSPTSPGLRAMPPSPRHGREPGGSPPASRRSSSGILSPRAPRSAGARVASPARYRATTYSEMHQRRAQSLGGSGSPRGSTPVNRRAYGGASPAGGRKCSRDGR